MANDVNRRLKRWPGWVALLFVVAGVLAVGVTRDAGPRTQDDRVDAITRRIACPVCDGESVYESQNNASRALREQVREMVGANELSDTEIIAFIETRYDAQVLLVPKATGFDALVWVLPAVVFICAAAGLAVAFRRWKTESALAAATEPTAAERALVEAALASDAAGEPVANSETS